MDKYTVLHPVFASYKFAAGIERDSTMAKRLGIEPTALSNYKSGARKLPDQAVMKLADGLQEMTVEDVFACANLAWNGTPEEDLTFWLGRLKNEHIKRTAVMIVETRKHQKRNGLTVQLA